MQFSHQTGQYIHSGEAQIYVEELGDSKLPALILLHGGFGSIEDFNSITPTLAKTFRLIGLDTRGHGKSTLGKTPLSYSLLADDLSHVINTLALSKFSILGFSDGGTTCYHYAAKEDKRLEKIITIGSGWELKPKDPEWEIYNEMNAEKWKSMFPESYEEYMALNPAPDWKCFAQNVISMWTNIEGYPNQLVKKIQNEALIIRGDQDMLTSRESMAKLGNLLKNMHYMNIPFADHVAFADQPEWVLSALHQFFNGSKNQ